MTDSNLHSPAYAPEKTVTLPLGDWLSICCAMIDAIDHNKAQGYRVTAQDQQALYARFRTQVGADLDAAAVQAEAARSAA